MTSDDTPADLELAYESQEAVSVSVSLHPLDFEALNQEVERRREWTEWRDRRDEEIMSHVLAEAVRVWYEWLKKDTGAAE